MLASWCLAVAGLVFAATARRRPPAAVAARLARCRCASFYRLSDANGWRRLSRPRTARARGIPRPHRARQSATAVARIIGLSSPARAATGSTTPAATTASPTTGSGDCSGHARGRGPAPGTHQPMSITARRRRPIARDHRCSHNLRRTRHLQRVRWKPAAPAASAADSRFDRDGAAMGAARSFRLHPHRRQRRQRAFDTKANRLQLRV